MSQEVDKVAKKIIKKLKSSDDNDKLAALTYLTRIFKTPQELINSKYANQIWTSLRSTQFLERALKGDETKNLVFMILSVFCNICPPDDLVCFIPILSEMRNIPEAEETLINISQKMKDISPLFKYNELNTASIEFFIKIFENCQGCSLTNDVFRGRSNLFKLLTGHEDLSLRRLVFVLLARICRTNSSIMIFSSTNTLNFDDFLMAERLAFIELRLQLDLPPNYLELDQMKEQKERIEHGETPKVSFTQEIGSLINPELSAASCELLEFLMVPLLDNEENFSDEDIDKYFKNINSILEECVAIFKAAKGKRDCQRNELKCLLSIFAKWLIEAPFLCGNKALIREIKSLVRLLWWFPREALLFIPALQELANGNAKQDMKLGINELGKKLNEFASDEEKIEIQKLIETVYK